MIYKKIKKSAYNIFYFGGIRRFKASKRSLPQFLIIGAQKAGTTSLFNYLISNEHIKRPLKKEIHYFSENYKKGELWYRMHFTIIRDDSITLDASTSYLFYPHAAKRVNSLIPDVKIIILLRDPVERAFSHYNHEVKIGNEKSSSFEEAIELEEKRTNNSYERMKIDENYYDKNVGFYSYIKKGIYIEQLKRWYYYFNRENILIIESKKFFKETYKTLERIASFLNIENRFYFKPIIYNRGRRSTEMSIDTRNFLKNYYYNYNKELFRLIGEEFDWNNKLYNY
ncbi:MAG: sulfotransferase domain-containing protein [Promethearchaeota archaeon]